MNSLNKEKNKMNVFCKIRVFTFVIILAWMALGPAYRQVLGGKNEIFRKWTMYGNRGLDMVDASFYKVKNGKLQEMNRFKILGYENRLSAPKEVFRIEGNEGVISVVNKLCEKLGGDADIRVKSRIATRKGWELQYKGENNFCSTDKR